MLRLADLQERRATLIKDMRAIADSPSGEGGDLSAEQQTKFDGFKTELATVEKNITRVQAVDEAERRMAGTPVHGAGDEFERELRNFSVARLMAAAFEPSVDAAREREVCAEQRRRTGKTGDGFLIPFQAITPARRMEQRVLTVAGDAANLVSTNVLGDEFIDALRPMAVTTRLGARVLTGLTGDIALPRRDNRNPTAAWFAEDSAIGSADQSFDQVAGVPRHLGLITQFSRKTLLQSTPGIEQLTREHLMAELGVGLDLGVLKGAGAPAPTGIINTASINTRDSNGAAPSWADIRAIVAQVEGADVPQDSLGWAMNADLKAKLGTVTKVSGDAGAGFILDANGTLAGAPIGVTSQLQGDAAAGSPQEDGEAIYAAWNQVIVAMWSGVEILINPYESTAYSKGNISVRGIVDADVLVRHPQAFTHWHSVAVA